MYVEISSLILCIAGVTLSSISISIGMSLAKLLLRQEKPKNGDDERTDSNNQV